MSKESNYHEFTTLPSNWTRPIWIRNTVEGKITSKVENESDPYKWGAEEFDPPAIGERVKVVMNKIGYGRVTTYFAEYGWLGVKVVPEDPPKWYIEQNGRDCAGHCFGPEIRREELGESEQGH